MSEDGYADRNTGPLVYSQGALFLPEPINPDGFPTVCIALADRGEPHTYGAQRDDNMQRLADCWNACEGIDNPADLLRQRDALLVAAEMILSAISVSEELGEVPMGQYPASRDVLRDAIAEAKGE